jgi:hypothetical protein
MVAWCRSGSFSRAGLQLPDDSALAVMNNLKSAWMVSSEEHAALVPVSVKDPERWLVHRCIQDVELEMNQDGCEMRKPVNHCLTPIDLSEVMHLFW